MNFRYKKIRRAYQRKGKYEVNLWACRSAYPFGIVTTVLSLLIITTPNISHGAAGGISKSNRNANIRTITIFDPFALRRISLASLNNRPKSKINFSTKKVQKIITRPTIRIPYRPSLRSPYRPPLVRRR